MTNYQKLISDLYDILELAKANEFHDFKNKSFATPKVQLVRILQKIIDNTKEGVYDQDSNE